MRAAFTWAVRIVLILATIALAWGGWLAWRFHATKPRLSGEVVVAGVAGEVTIAFDERGVPHIFGGTDADVFFAIGYVHAQERFFQMDLARRAMQGRLAELLGASAVRSDARARIVGWRIWGEEVVKRMPDAPKKALEAYAAGVNARLARGTPAPEYALLMVKPEPWRLEDSAAVAAYMIQDLVTGWSIEADPARLKAGGLSAERVEEFLAPYPDWAPTTFTEAELGLAPPAPAQPVPPEEGRDPAPEIAAPASPPTDGPPAPGSNNWVVSGALSASGKPLLANDPHLSLATPSIWYFARLSLSSADVVGATLAGLPFVILGHNGTIAWGATNTGFDALDPAPFPKGSLTTTERVEEIKVRFGKTVKVTARATAEGPILDPAYFSVSYFGEDVDVVLRTVEDDLDNDLATAGMARMLAKSFDSFLAAGATYKAPTQNWIYADRAGNIGYATPGRNPIRDADGRWTGEIPPEALPKVLNPARGFIATANNQIAPDAYPYALNGQFDAFRIMRILDRLPQTKLHDKASFRDLHLDVVSVRAQRVLAALSRARPETAVGLAALGELRDWDGDMRADSRAALIYSAWRRELPAAVYEDELGETFSPFNYDREVFLDSVLNGELSHWCDHVGTPERETCAVTLGRALDRAGAKLVEQFGPDVESWRWGAANVAVFDHPLGALLGGLPGMSKLLNSRVSVGGDGSTVNVANSSIRSGRYDVHAGASMRAIYDLADLDSSLFSFAPGQSGHPLSPHYRDLVNAWAAGDYFEIRTDWDLEAPPPGMKLLKLTPKAKR